MSDELVCRSCNPRFPSPVTHIANAYAGRKEEGSSWDWPLCKAHMPFAMVAGWSPVRKIGEGKPYDPVAYIKGEPVVSAKKEADNG